VRKYKTLTITVVIILTMSISVPVFASSGVTYVDRFWVSGNYTGNVQFIPAHVVEKNEPYALSPGRHVKRAYLTAQRYTNLFGVKVFDSGRQYSNAASSSSQTSTFYKGYDIWNLPGFTEKIFYGFEYF